MHKAVVVTVHPPPSFYTYFTYLKANRRVTVQWARHKGSEDVRLYIRHS